MKVVGLRLKSALLGQCLSGDAKQTADRKYFHQNPDQQEAAQMKDSALHMPCRGVLAPKTYQNELDASPDGHEETHYKDQCCEAVPQHDVGSRYADWSVATSVQLRADGPGDISGQTAIARTRASGRS